MLGSELAEFPGLWRWMCAVMLGQCTGPESTAKVQPGVVEAGDTAVTVRASLVPVVDDGRPGRCVVPDDIADLQITPPQDGVMTAQDCKVRCISSGDVAT